MIRKIQLAILLSLALFGASLSAATLNKGVVTLRDGSKGVVEIVDGKPNAPVFVLLNGLVYDTHRWDPVTANLAKTGATVIRSAYAPQPENLRLLKAGEEPLYFKKGLELSKMAHDLADVLDSQGISTPVQLVGLSYGSSVATEFARLYPSRVANLVLIAPLVIPLDNYNPGGRSLKIWLDSVRFWENTPCSMYGSINPWLCVGQNFWYDSLYDYVYGTYLRERVKSIPPGVDEAVYKKAIFHLVRAARDFDLKLETPRLNNVYMLVAEGDDAPLLVDQAAAWKATRAKERNAFVVFDGARHALPDEAPGRTAEVLVEIASGKTYAKAKVVHVKADH
ncbi:MAG: alpha/beta hydrolase [Bdellovibrionota bacterium]